MKKITNAYTHSGGFHADDVFSSALLRMIYPDLKIHRVHIVPEEAYNEESIVYDVGLGEYDHHQQDSPVREDGTPYAAFGLLWREFAKYLPGMNEEIISAIDEKFVKELDLSDNTGEYNALSSAIGFFNPPWNSSQPYDEAFEEAVKTASEILKKVIQREAAKDKAKIVVQNALDKMTNGIVILEEFAPWEDVLVDSEAVYVVYPSMRTEGAYNVQGVPKEKKSREVKKKFPQEWCECPEEELPQASGLNGLTFCHKNGFLIACKNLESALQAAEYSINN